MSELYLVRHGQASFGTDNYDQLSDLGGQQARWLGEYFANREIQFDDLYHGSLVRHQQTMQGILQGMGLDDHSKLITDPAINEFDFENVVRVYCHQHPEEIVDDKSPRADFYRLLRKAFVKWQQGELQGELTETWQQFEQRTHGFISALQNNSGKGRRHLVVSSGGAIAAMLAFSLGLDASKVIEFNLQIKNTSITKFYFSDKSISLNEFNNVPHLDSDLDEARLRAITYS